MVELTVRRDMRPRIGRYIVRTSGGLLVLNGSVVVLRLDIGPTIHAGQVGSLVLLALTLVANVGILFWMIGSYVETWLCAVEITDTEPPFDTGRSPGERA